MHSTAHAGTFMLQRMSEQRQVDECQTLCKAVIGTAGVISANTQTAAVYLSALSGSICYGCATCTALAYAACTDWCTLMTIGPTACAQQIRYGSVHFTRHSSCS
jgi:hypothetical protein